MIKDIKLRTESFKDKEIIDLAVINDQNKKIVNALKSSEPCLLEGSRGTGKSYLMKIAQLDIDESTTDCISVYISFNISSLINTSDGLQFYHWMLAKTLCALLSKLRKKGMIISEYSKNLLSNDSSEDISEIDLCLKKIVKLYEQSYKNNETINIETLPDIEDVKDAISEICEENNLQKVYFFFDEAAHVFRPDQQRQFFNLFKDLRSAYITCNAAIYPGVTHFGDSFEPNHDCIYQILDRNIKDDDYISYFRSMIEKQADKKTVDSIKKQDSLFKTLAYACGGNPRNLLRTLQDLNKLTTQDVNKVLKDFYRIKIWSEHTEIGDKYRGHRVLVDWGRDFLEKTVIQNIIENEKSTIYFWIDKDIPETVKESLRLLTYTGIIKKLDSSIRSHGKLGDRYEVKYGCIIALNGKPVAFSNELFPKISVRLFTEFGKNNPEYDKIIKLSSHVEEEKSYKESLDSMLSKSITVLSLTNWKKTKLLEANYRTIKDLWQLKEEDLIENIYNVGPSRSRTIMNAVHAELLEYISG